MITDIRLQNFRSYRDESFEFSDGVNIIVGPNASGKTNLLEAILVIARGASYRAKDVELVRFRSHWARLDSHILDGLRTVKIVVDPYPEKTYEIDDKMYKRLSLQDTLPLVLFEPNHLLLLNGSPDRRREYLDDLLEHVRPGYAALRRKYKRTLAQRNALLKKGYEAAEGQLFPWNVRLSELGGNIAKSRNELVDTIDRAIAPLYKDLSRTKAKVGISYQPQFPIENYETSLLKKLEASALLDSQRGFTAAGPHREDFLTMLGGKPSGETASRGEVRTCILALKIIELDIIEKARGAKPILLLDDVFSELDGARRRALTEHLQPHQTFITTTDADVVAKHFTEHSNIIPIQA